MQALKTKQQERCSQFVLTTNIITKLNTFKLTPTAKLVLLYLTTCYNPKHREVFPKQKTIADKLGVSEVSVTRAIFELHKEGLILSERKYTNRYVFTSRIVSEQAINLIDDNIQKDNGENVKLIAHDIEQTKEPYKEPKGFNKGGNVYSTSEQSARAERSHVYCERSCGDDEILADYAVKHKAKSVNAYIAKLKETGSAAKIIKEYKAKSYAAKKALRSIEETQSLIKQYEMYRMNTVTAAECGCSLEQVFGQKNKVSV